MSHQFMINILSLYFIFLFSYMIFVNEVLKKTWAKELFGFILILIIIIILSVIDLSYKNNLIIKIFSNVKYPFLFGFVPTLFTNKKLKIPFMIVGTIIGIIIDIILS